MDIWKYFGITHTDHTLKNPMSLAKTQELVDLLRLPDGGRILDIACGKAEFLCLVAQRYEVTGIGLDLSRIAFEAAQRNVAAWQLADRIELLNMDGADYELDRPGSLDMASCIGASWIYQGHQKTLEVLKDMVKPGGLVLAGEPFWRITPEPEYLVMTGQEAGSYGSHASNVQAGVDLGLTFWYAIVSSEDDWDRYEGLQWQAAERHVAAHPEDPDAEALLGTLRKNRDAYLRWGRDCLGWATYLFSAP